MMDFRFHVHLTDEDYLDYNIFWVLRSPYGKKQMIKFRIIFAALTAVVFFLSLLGGGFSADAFVGAIPYLVVLILVQLLLDPFFIWVLKGHIKSLKKQGKMGYSPDSEMEFFEDYFVEVTPQNKTEQKYSVLERISVIENKCVYIHVNNVMSYILPMACFASKEEYGRFMEFIKTKCTAVDIY